MKALATVVGLLLLMAIVAFCAFGFLATFEPTGKPRMFMAFRIGYAVVGIACLAGTIGLVVKTFGKPRSI